MAQRPGRELPLAGLLIAALAACAPSTPSAGPTDRPTPPGGATPTPIATVAGTATPTPPTPASSASTAACEADSIKVSHDVVEGAAGTRFTMAVLTSNVACSISAFPALGLRDANGTALVGSAAAQPGVIDLLAGVAYESEISFANWCAAEPPFPLTLALVLGAAEVPITGDSFPDEGEMPQCLATTGPQLTGTGWAPAADGEVN